MCVSMGMCVEVRVQLPGLGSLLPLVLRTTLRSLSLHSECLYIHCAASLACTILNNCFHTGGYSVNLMESRDNFEVYIYTLNKYICLAIDI